MTTKPSEPGMSTGAKVGIAVIGLALVAMLAMGRGGSETPPAEEPVAEQKAARQPMGVSKEKMGQRFGSGTGDGGPRGQNEMAAESKRNADGSSVPARPIPKSAANTAQASDTDLDQHENDIPALQRVVTSDPDPERRLAAVTMLGATDDPSAINVLSQALGDEDEEVRMEAVLALADFVDEAPVQALGRALNDPSADIRYEALDAISDIETPEATRLIQAALQDPDEDVRELAEINYDLRDDN